MAEMTTGKQAYTEYVEAQFVEPAPSTADALVERLDREFLQYRAADVVYAMATLLGYSLARFREHNIEDTEGAMQAIGELIALSAAQELRRSRS